MVYVNVATDMCQIKYFIFVTHAGMILGLQLINERSRYNVTPSLIGLAQTYNQHCLCIR